MCFSTYLLLLTFNLQTERGQMCHDWHVQGDEILEKKTARADLVDVLPGIS